MKQYMIGMYQPDGVVPSPEFLAPVMRELGVIETEMRDQGVWVFSGGLHQPDTATVLDSRGGEVVATDGPYTEGKEHLGGFTVVKADHLDEALAWGRRIAAATNLPIEVRPFQGEV